MELRGLEWRAEGSCAGKYLAYDSTVDATSHAAATMSQQFITTFCMGCRVRTECGSYGRDTGSTGLFGGERLEFGRPTSEKHVARRQRRPRRRTTATPADNQRRPKE